MPNMTEQEIIAKATEYHSWDPNPVTKDAMQQLIDSKNFTTLEKVLSSRLAFGTAGLRGMSISIPSLTNRTHLSPLVDRSNGCWL